MTYEAFRGSGLDLSAVGFMPGGEAYFCTPVGAAILGRAGVDGIHFCTAPETGDMILAVSPANGAEDCIHPVARDFPDFLRLLLAKLYVCDRSTVDDHIRTVDLSKMKNFVCFCNIKRIFVCIQNFNFQRIQHFINCLANLAFRSYDPYFQHVFGKPSADSHRWHIRSLCCGGSCVGNFLCNSCSK